MKKCVSYGALAVAGLGLASAAQAYEIRTRWVFDSMVGVPLEPVPLVGGIPVFDASVYPVGTPIRFRLRFGVFDDDAGPAPAGGYFGWNEGTLTATGGLNTRTGSGSTPADPRGRLIPFNFAPDPPAEGLPQTDPWMALTEIDNTLGTQALAWNSVPGNPGVPPPPAAIVRGRNTFISTWELTIVTGTSDYTITAAGDVRACLQWNVVEQTPPGPGGDGVFGTPDDVPGSIRYEPVVDAARPFTTTLTILVPAPGAVALIGLGGLVALRRRR